nr:hypothetical protein BaRGS_024339 [Batillaria attramentaria]
MKVRNPLRYPDREFGDRDIQLPQHKKLHQVPHLKERPRLMTVILTVSRSVFSLLDPESGSRKEKFLKQKGQRKKLSASPCSTLVTTTELVQRTGRPV